MQQYILKNQKSLPKFNSGGPPQIKKFKLAVPNIVTILIHGDINMDDKKIILILIIIIVVLASIASFLFLNSYKEVDSNYVYAPLPNEKVRFTGTYLGPDDSTFNFDQKRGVLQVGSAYAIINTDKVQGLEGQTITVEGYFVNDKADATTVPINNRHVSGEHFCLEKVVDVKTN